MQIKGLKWSNCNGSNGHWVFTLQRPLAEGHMMSTENASKFLTWLAYVWCSTHILCVQVHEQIEVTLVKLMWSVNLYIYILHWTKSAFKDDQFKSHVKLRPFLSEEKIAFRIKALDLHVYLAFCVKTVTYSSVNRPHFFPLFIYYYYVYM